MKTRAVARAIVCDVQDDQSSDVPPHESLIRHPIHATVHEAEHLREIADEGASPKTPAILVGAVLAFIIPFAALLMLLAFEVAAHFS